MGNASLLYIQEKPDGSVEQAHKNSEKSEEILAQMEDGEDDRSGSSMPSWCFLFVWRRRLKDKLQQHRYFCNVIIYSCAVTGRMLW